MITKLTKLTKQQEDLIPFIRDKWINKVFQKSEREKFDEEKVKLACKWLYGFCKLQEPEVVILDSPLACQYYANLGDTVRYNVWDNVWKNVEDNAWKNVRSDVWDSVGANVRYNVEKNVEGNVRGNVGKNVRDNVRDNVWDSVGKNIMPNVWDNVWANVRYNAGKNVRDNVGGKYITPAYYGDISDYRWVSFGDYFNEIGLDLGGHFTKYKEYCKNPIFYSIQLEGLNVVSRPPAELRYTEKSGIRQLHCEDAPAIEFVDGYCQHYIHGVFLSPELFAKAKTMSYEEIIAIENIEQRYAILQMEANQGKMLKTMDLIDSYKTTQTILSTEITKYSIAEDLVESIMQKYSKDKEVIYDLYKTKNNKFFGEVAYFLSYHCPSTNRHYLSGIDPEIAKLGAKASILWKSGKTDEEFNQILLHS